MTKALPFRSAARADALAEVPAVPLRPRPDGWTPDRQRQFLEHLADCGCVSMAVRAVGLSKESAYRLRRHPQAALFARAWDAAIAHGIRRLSDEAMERAILGEEVPVYHKGELVGTRRRYSDRLVTFLLRHHDPALYGGPYDYNFTQPKDRRSRVAKQFCADISALELEEGDENEIAQRQ